MKTVTGKIISSTPIPLSKAGKFIAKFAATENGASQAVCGYLRRTSASFNELIQLHREIKRGSKSKHNLEKPKSETFAEEYSQDTKKRKREEPEDVEETNSSEHQNSKKKKKNREKKIKVEEDS